MTISKGNPSTRMNTNPDGKRLGKHGGFTLIEALVSVALVSIGLVGLNSAVGVSLGVLGQSTLRGQLDSVAQMVVSDLSADIDHLAHYQVVLDNELVPLELVLQTPCNDSTTACTNRNRWSQNLSRLLGASASATLTLYPLCSPVYFNPCPRFDSAVGVRRSAILTLQIGHGRGYYLTRRVLDVRDST